MAEKSIALEDARKRLKNIAEWKLDKEGKSIYREYVLRDFMTGLDFINRIAEVAEEENHHPNIHLTGYRHLRVELTTDDIGGLSEKDFTEASKINDLPVALKRP